MGLAIESYPVMPSRPCSFCLCLQGGSVFADFDTDHEGVVSILRISFDGFGCCHVQVQRRMDAADSHSLLEAVARNEFGGSVDGLLHKYFRQNSDVIWHDALVAHDLI